MHVGRIHLSIESDCKHVALDPCLRAVHPLSQAYSPSWVARTRVYGQAVRTRAARVRAPSNASHYCCTDGSS